MSLAERMERQRGRHISAERGQGSNEFLGIVVVAAISVAALVFGVSTSSPAVRDTVVAKICEITTLGQGACEAGELETLAGPGEDALPWFLDPALTPEQAATRGDYVALGDSFSSGEGGSAYEEGTDVDNEAQRDAWEEAQEGERPYHNMCHRSTHAFPQQLDDSFDFAGELTFAACSGATTREFTEPNAWNDDEAAQLDHLDETTSLVTLSIGGNDAEFGPTLRDCIFRGLNPFSSCADDAERIEADIARALENLDALLPQLRERAPNARILVLGYPRFFPEDALDWYADGTIISPDDTRFINDMIARMNAGIEERVAVYNAGSIPGNLQYVDVSDAFDGCEIGTADPCMNNVQFWNAGSFNLSGSYHPNDRGHERYATILEEAIRHGP